MTDEIITIIKEIAKEEGFKCEAYQTLIVRLSNEDRFVELKLDPELVPKEKLHAWLKGHIKIGIEAIESWKDSENPPIITNETIITKDRDYKNPPPSKTIVYEDAMTIPKTPDYSLDKIKGGYF